MGVAAVFENEWINKKMWNLNTGKKLFLFKY
jgi:hypothetical protein